MSTCLEQITYADLLILNKADRVSADTLNDVERFIRGLNLLATIQRVTHSAVDMQALLAMGGGFAEDDPTAAHAGRGHGHHDHHDHHHHHDHDDHQHDESIRPVVVQVDGDVDVAALDLWLGELARQKDTPLLRMKGVLSVPGDLRRFVFFGVRVVVDVRPGSPWADEGRFCRIVMIGRSLDFESLQAGFTACRA